jgi:hypothetical protein
MPKDCGCTLHMECINCQPVVYDFLPNEEEVDNA